MTSNHAVRGADEASFEVPEPFAGDSKGFVRWSAIGRHSGSVHMEFGICELEQAGSVPPHVHSFEESFYLLEGEAVCETPEGAFLVRPGDYGIIPVGAPHAWRNPGSGTARWAEMLAPQPRVAAETDTFLVEPISLNGEPEAIDARDPRTRSFGHIDAANMEVGKQTQDMLAVSASMRTALLVYSGITVKMMVDGDLGSFLQTMFMVQYEPGGLAGAHDHPLEEAYLILDGEVDAVFDGERYRLRPGDIAWAGVGCTHEFSNPADVPVRWLETQAPQPPARHSYRFARDWNYLRDAIV